MGRDGSGRKGMGTGVLWSPITSLKYTLVKGAIPHCEPSLLCTIALFRLIITAWKPVFIWSLKLLIIRHEGKLDQPRGVYAHIELCSKRIKIRRREFWKLRGDCGKYKMLVIQQQIVLAAWRSGNGVGRINEVTLRRARLGLGWVTCTGSTPGGGTLFRYVTSHAGRLSFSSFRVR